MGFIGIGNLISSLSTRVKALENANNYSTTEKVVGKWIDGKPIYQKTIDFGTLPNKTTKTVAHGISNLKYVVNLFGFSSRGVTDRIIPIPYGASAASGMIQFDIGGTDRSAIRCTTAGDFSDFVITYVTLQYTKTTD